MTSFAEAAPRGPAPAVVNSKDGRGPAVVLLGDLNRDFAANLVVRWTEQGELMRNHDALYIVVHAPRFAVDELRSFWADLPQYGEVWVERPDGTRVCALVSSPSAWLMYLRGHGDAGFSTRNPRYTGPPDTMLKFVLSNDQRDAYPAAWAYPVDEVLRALERFALDGVFPREIEWHNDSGDGSSPPTESY